MSTGINPNTLATIITIAIAFAALIFTIINSNRTAKKDLIEDINREDSKFDSLKEGIIKMNVKLDTVCQTTNETRSDVKAMNKDMAQLQTHMTALDEKFLAVERRVTELENHVYEK